MGRQLPSIAFTRQKRNSPKLPPSSPPRCYLGTQPGCFGNEAYVATAWLAVEGKSVGVSLSNVSIAFVEPRTLHITVRACRLAFDLLVAHCPTSLAPLQDYYDYILTLKGVVRRCHNGEARLFAAIHGCRVGSVESTVIPPLRQTKIRV